MKFRLLVVGFLVFLAQSLMAQDTMPTGPYLVPDSNYETEVLALINHSQTSIDLIHKRFFAEAGAPANVLNALIAKKAQLPKIKIRVLLELDNNVRNFRTEEKLSKAGIEVVKSFVGSVQAKAICVDEKRLLIGSTSLSKTSMTKSDEMNALIESETIGKAFTGYFTEVAKNPATLVNLRVSDGQVTLITDNSYYNEIMDTIRSATVTLDISMYLFRVSKEKDQKVREIFQALVEAQKKNVKIRILLDQSSSDLQVTVANMEVQKLLKSNGINAVYLDNPERSSHSRFVIADQKEVLTGSTSWYAADLESNHHVNVKIENPPLAKQLTVFFSQKVAYEGSREPVPAPRRFWIGFRRPDVSPQDFAKGINERLIHDTKVGAERGLVGYTPTLLEGLSTMPDLPQEIAMVTYQDDETYRAIRETPEGTAYGNLHWDYFAKELPSGLKSGSAVAVPYQGQVAFGSAYYRTKGLKDFQNLEWSYSVLVRKSGESDPDFLDRVKNYTEKLFTEFTPLGLVDYTFRIEKNFIFEYHVWKSKEHYSRAQMFLGLLRAPDFGVLRSGLLSKGPFGQTHIESGEGVNVQFVTKIESPEKVYSPLREKFLSPMSKEPLQILAVEKKEINFNILLNSCRMRFQRLLRSPNN